MTRHNKWLCEACRGWRRHYEVGECPSCRRQIVVNERGCCRLCCRLASRSRPHLVVDVIEANSAGQQLFFAEMILKKRRPVGWPTARPVMRGGLWPASYPVGHRQLLLFEWPKDLGAVTAQPPLPELAAAMDRAIDDHAARHGWHSSLRLSTARGIRVLLAAQDTPGAAITNSEAARLRGVPNCTVQPVLDVLASIGMLDDDRAAPLEGFFEAQIADMSEPMASEYRHWFHALRDGSKTHPRSHPRSIETVRHRIAATAPALTAWSQTGHRSLREITQEDVLDALPQVAYKRRQVLDSLRSLFRFLKGRKIVFVNPTARMRSERTQLGQPMPLALGRMRDAVNSSEPVRAALASLIAFHALTSRQLRSLQLTDVREGRLFLADRTVVLADPVRERIAAWLAERARKWPNSANPHLFINQYSAVRTGPVSSY